MCGHRLVWSGHWPSRYFMSMNTRTARNPGLYLVKDRAGSSNPGDRTIYANPYTGTVNIVDVLQLEFQVVVEAACIQVTKH